jgi:hypothetical protein
VGGAVGAIGGLGGMAILLTGHGTGKLRAGWRRIALVAPVRPSSSAMDQYRDLTMREYLDRLAAEDDRGDAVATVRGHHDKITAFRLRSLNDCPVGMLMLDMNSR